MSQQINIIGQVATDPKIFQPASGVQFCTFRVACTERRFDSQKNEWVDGDTNWFTANIFRALAVHASESFKKGDRIIVSGRLRIRNWEKDEKRGTSVEIDVDGIGHDLRWGVSKFTKRTGAGVQEEASSSGDQSGSSDQSASQPSDASITPGSSAGQSMGNWATPSGSGEHHSTSNENSALSEDGFTPAAA